MLSVLPHPEQRDRHTLNTSPAGGKTISNPGLKWLEPATEFSISKGSFSTLCLPGVQSKTPTITGHVSKLMSLAKALANIILHSFVIDPYSAVRQVAYCHRALA